MLRCPGLPDDAGKGLPSSEGNSRLPAEAASRCNAYGLGRAVPGGSRGACYVPVLGSDGAEGARGGPERSEGRGALARHLTATTGRITHMIVDTLVSWIASLFNPVLNQLPDSSLGLPDPTSLANNLAGLDGLVPVLGVLRLGAVMLSALLVFLIVRVIVFVRYLLLP